jgi:hypothetical protein
MTASAINTGNLNMEPSQLLREIRDIAKVVLESKMIPLLNEAETLQERINASAAVVLLDQGVQILRNAFGSLDIHPQLPFDYLPEKDDAELARFVPGHCSFSAIALRNQLDGKISLEQAQAALLIAIGSQIEAAKMLFEQVNRLAGPRAEVEPA